MPKAKVEKSYDELKLELDEVMLQLQSEDLDVDSAVVNYEKGLELIKSLQIYLRNAENKVSELKAKFETK